ncbi:MAG: hypothetical protein FWE13_02220 [Firmicutes bacterium]|nr:hypothetical protein [Bacillota bacterium]
MLDAQAEYAKVINEYEQILKGYSYDCFELGVCEKVFVIEDSFVIIACLVNFSSDVKFVNPTIIFEEFTYNEIFKFNISAFKRKFDYYLIRYYKFTGKLGVLLLAETEGRVDEFGRIKNYATDKPIIPSFLNKITTTLPELEIEKRFLAWRGFFYNFIIYELKDEEKTGYAICSTTTQSVHSIAQSRADDIGFEALANYKIYENNGYLDDKLYEIKGIACDMNIIEILVNRIQVGVAEEWKNRVKKNHNKYCFVEKGLQYFIVPTYIKREIDIIQTRNEVLKNAQNDLYSHLERHEYLILEYKWKSEQYVYELVKKLYGDKKVTHQHRPYFLQGLSYDIFIFGENIAIEYQGKQHFESVGIFGGEKNFATQKERDELKLKLSKENDVKLVYINYWEDISLELIREKIERIKQE